MILVYSQKNSPRLEWVCKVLFSEILKVDVTITTDIQVFKSFEHAKINYSDSPIAALPFIRPQGILFETGISNQEVSHSKSNIHKLFINHDDFLGFDIFSAVFYLLSRYEEYLPHKKDRHKRYAFENSLACKYNFIDQPVVDLWSILLKDNLQKLFPETSFPNRKFKYIATMDVDVGFAYRGRSIFRNLGSTAKDLLNLDIKRIIKRISVFFGKKDPFDTYEYFNQKVAENKIDKRYFFLLGDYGVFDKNLDWEKGTLRNVIIANKEHSGSHPSYFANEKHELLVKEKNRLEAITNETVIRSRFHYLKFSIPESYRSLAKAGYKEDYSMCYPEMPGFRAGTCNPYTFYDLSSEEALDLKIIPTTVMDATCQDYLKLSPVEALTRIESLTREVKKVNGTFVCLWHNDSLSNTGKWEGWREVFKKSISMR